MDATALAADVAAHQSPGGAFQSTVRLAFGDVTDRNCFVTALVLRELDGIDGLDEARRRALGFLTRSRYPVHHQLFSFYPYRNHPFWMPKALYPDADDTAVVSVELFRAGLLDRSGLIDVAHRLLAYRATGELALYTRPHSQPSGPFLTWLTTASVENPVDYCVNTNVVALLRLADMQSTEAYRTVCQMINRASEAASAGPVLRRQLTPFYPCVREWYRAARHAVEIGAEALTPALEQLGRIDGARELGGDQVCSDSSGTVVWNADVLHVARRLRAALLDGTAICT